MQQNVDNLIEMVIDPQKFLPDLTTDRVKILLMELDGLIEEFDREMSIMYLSGNYASNKHLCVTVLRGKNDSEIIEAMEGAKITIKEELKRRKHQDS